MKSTTSAEIEVSYFEIYNEKIHDLLAVTPTHLPNATPGSQVKRQALQIREHPQWGPYIENLNIHPVDSNIALKNWLAVGNSQRATAATGMNDKSSRSHSIFSIILTLTETDSGSSKLTTKRSRISLVDLAGSERVSQTCASGERLKEGVSINRSLLTLGRVINALADPKKNTFAPYRESVLTWLLKVSIFFCSLLVYVFICSTKKTKLTNQYKMSDVKTPGIILTIVLRSCLHLHALHLQHCFFTPPVKLKWHI